MVAIRLLSSTHRWKPQRAFALAVGLLVSVFVTPAAEAQSTPPAAEPSPLAAPFERTAPPSPDQISEWISELGHDTYTVRQAASERLLASGYAARPALRRVAGGSDPEIRAAARRLLTLIDRSEFERRLAEFASDVDGRRGVTLPGWPEFSELVGNDESARALYVEMQREDAVLLEEVFNGRVSSDFRWEERIARLINWHVVSRRREPAAPLGSCAAVFFIGTRGEARMSDLAARNLVRLAERPPISTAMQGGGDENALRRVITAWIIHCPSRDDEVLGGRLNLMFGYGLTEALPLAVAAARGESNFMLASPARRAMAIQAVGRFGSTQHVTALEPLLEDQTELLRRPVSEALPARGHSIELRDVALAMMLHLTGQDPQEYGFSNVRRHDQLVYDVTSLGMEGEAQRAAAIAKWHEWKAANEPEAARPDRARRDSVRREGISSTPALPR